MATTILHGGAASLGVRCLALAAAFAFALAASGDGQAQAAACGNVPVGDVLAHDTDECQDVSLLQHDAFHGKVAADAAARRGPKGKHHALPPTGRELLEKWAKAKALQPSLLEPTPLRQEDKDFLAFLGTSEGKAVLDEAKKSKIEVPDGWGGPLPPPPELWGGPSERYAAAAANFTKQSFDTAKPQDAMDYSRAGSAIPESLWGIWWMDQAGFSSVAKDPNYDFAMVATAEMLASFPDTSLDDNWKFGARYEKKTRCVTPIECYGGPQWAAQDNSDGNHLMRAHTRTRNTLSFCYNESMTGINIYQKMLTDQASIGAIRIGPEMAHLLGYIDAGNGYSWTPGDVMNMTMVKYPWGWDRVTTVGGAVHNISPLMEWFLHNVLPQWVWELIKAAQYLQTKVVSHYPLLQVVDGEGKPTKYMAEFKELMTHVENGGSLQIRMPK